MTVAAAVRPAEKDRPLEVLGRAPPSQPLDLESITLRWQVALNAAERALRAAEVLLPGQELGRRQSQLLEERLQTAEALGLLARVVGS
jgi:hypothetical protein